MIVVIAAAQAFPFWRAEVALGHQMTLIEPGSTIRFRGTTPEMVLLSWIATPQRERFWGGDRVTNYTRDNRIVLGADCVYAYFHPDAIMEGGTAHIVEKALDHQIPVQAFSILRDELTEIGSFPW